MKLKTFLFGSGENKKIVLSFLLVPASVVFILFVGILLTPFQRAEIASYPNPEALEEETVKYPFTTSVLWAPLIEESFFRAPILFSYLIFFKRSPVKEKYRFLQLIGKIFTIFIAITLTFGFAAIHIYNGGFYLLRTTLFHTGVFSVVMVLLAIKTKSMTYPVLAHAINNYLYWMFG